MLLLLCVWCFVISLAHEEGTGLYFVEHEGIVSCIFAGHTITHCGNNMNFIQEGMLQIHLPLHLYRSNSLYSVLS
jgi:hypothetical protein